MVDFTASSRIRQGEPAEHRADDAGEQCSQRAHLGRGRDPGVEQHQHQKDQQKARPDAHEACPALLPADAKGAGRVLGAHDHPEIDHGRKQDAGNKSRDNAGDQKLADGGLRRDAVDHHRDARRDQDIKGRADADRAGGKFVRIAVTAHFRHRDLGHHRRRGSARAGHGAEDAAGEDGGDRKPALDVRAPVACRGVKVAREPARGGEKCHQNEHRDRRQGVIRHRAEWQPG